ncbi:MAG: hypothetical protein EA353_05870 [Puniceicoccaceae bacterium]|nr:MAG: hypothetical protein EA353_05870 [Puniceicoccaceae bacterium]
MPRKDISILAASALLISLFTACGGSREMRVTEGRDPVGAAPTGSVFLTSEATIVHVNQRERLATMRNGSLFPPGTFVQTVNREGEQTGLLKVRPKRPTGLRTADILEGLPDINNRAVAVSEAESRRLKAIYRDATED